MRKKLLFALFALCPALLSAGPVDKDEARQKAVSFFSTKYPSKLKKAAGTAAADVREVAADSAYYIFNVGDGDGYVIVSASDQTQTILGYADEGSFDPAQVPAPLQDWLKQLSTAVKTVDADETQERVLDPSRRKAPRMEIREPIATMIPSRWNQGSPYNLYMPYYKKDDGTMSSGDDRAATGCVATAMAQVMYYWKWPQEATTEIPGYSSNWNMSRTFDPLPATTFKWDDMTDTYSDNSSTEAKEAVAELMLYVGHSIQMGYGPESGAGTTSTINALKNCYNYNPNLFYAYYTNYTYQEWEDLFYSELKAGRPLLMNADNYERTGGHEFVCDGYDGNGLFHMNWGWGGMSDGYFLLTVMKPDAEGIGGSTASDGYSMGQGVVVGLEPAGRESVDEGPVRLSLSTVTTENASYTRNTRGYATVKLTYRVASELENTYSYDHGFSVYDEAGNIVPVSGSEVIALDSKFSMTGKTAATRTKAQILGLGMEEGTYYLRGRSRKNGTTEWLNDDKFDGVYLTMTISSTTISFSQSVKTSKDLVVNSLELVGNSVVGTQQKVKVNYTNNGADYYNDTYLYVDGALTSGNTIYVASDNTVDIYYTYTPSSTGVHTFVLSESLSKSGSAPSNYYYKTTLDVQEGEQTTLAVTGKMLSNYSTSNSNKYVYTNQVRIQGTVRNTGSTPYQGNVKSSSWKLSGNWWVQTQAKSSYVEIPAGESVEVVFVYNDLDYNGYYDFHVDTDISGASTNLSGYNIAKGIRYWTADGTENGAATTNFAATADMVAIEIPGSSPTSIASTAIENPNVILYFDEGATVASRVMNVYKRKTTNIVFGSTAESITLDDRYSLYVPKSIQAESVTYTRTVPSEASASSSWSTLTLPFAPQQVTADGTAIDWFHSADDTDKGLVIKEFKGASGNMLYYEPATELAANKPYIISYAGTVNGTTFDQSGKTLMFSATDGLVEAAAQASSYTTNYKCVGTRAETELSNVYTLDADGRKFTAVEQTTVSPFRAYFVANNAKAGEAGELLIVDETATTAIRRIVADGVATDDDAVYTLSGVKVGTVKQLRTYGLPKGVYIVNGRKYIL